MTTATTTGTTATTGTSGSAFPPSVDELVPRVRARAIELGRVPSRNQVMREFRVGRDKARAVLDALTTEPNPATRPEITPTPTVLAGDYVPVEADPDYQAHLNHPAPIVMGCPYCPDPDDLTD